MLVDPKVHDLAGDFVDDVFDDLRRAGKEPPPRAPFVMRAAQAMQRAIEDEVEAIRQELTP